MTPILQAFAAAAPLVNAWLKNGDHNDVATQVFGLAEKLTGESDPFLSWQALSQNIEMLCGFQQAVMRHELERQKADLTDRAGARGRDRLIIQNGRTNRRADLMVCAAAIGLLSCLLVMTWFRDTLPGEAVGIISTVAGIFGACLKDAYAFEFGSSRGSREKDSNIAALFQKGGL